MKIAIDCRMLKSGGIGSYLAALIPFFLKENKCLLIGNEADLIAYNNNDNADFLYTDIKPFSFKDIFYFPKKFLNLINSCDCFYSPYCNIPNGIKIPVFSTIHDVIFLDIPSLAGTFGTFVRNIFYKICIHRSTKLFTVSNFSRERINYHLKPKIDIITTYNGLPHWFNEKNFNITKENYILFVGNIKKHKGLHTLAKALNICIEKNFTTKLKIVGNAENFRTNDENLKEELAGLSEYVEFTGRISDEELRNVYCKAKLLIQPSLYEGFGMPPMEAISLGTNAIISDIPVFKEIYNELPVIFFESENASDLAEKIISNYDLTSPKIEHNPYSFERTYNIIINNLNIK